MIEENINKVKKRLYVEAIFLLIYLLLTAYVFFTLSTSRPHAGMWQDFLIIILMPGIIHRSFHVLHISILKKAFKRRWLSATLSVLAGIAIAVKLINLSSDLAVQRLTIAYQPLVNALTTGGFFECENEDHELNIPSIIRPTFKDRDKVENMNTSTIYFSSHYFVIEIRGWSIDIDGSTLYYNSNTSDWILFHNDIEDKRKLFQELIKDANSCTVTEINI
jgi:hypothetical protein